MLATCEHLAEFPVSASTYSNRGCRCTGCCKANTVRCVNYHRTNPAARQRKRIQAKRKTYY